MNRELSSEEVNAVPLQELGIVAMLLGDIWKQEVDAELLVQLRGESCAAALQQVGADLAELDGQRDHVLELLAIDYCQLLVGPADAHSPVQSVWNENRYHGEAFASCQKFYDLLDDRTDAEISVHQAMADHFGLQLHFLGRVLCQMAETSATDAAGDLARTFFQLHVSWIPKLLIRVQDSAESRFYKTMARTTIDFLTLVRESIGIEQN